MIDLKDIYDKLNGISNRIDKTLELANRKLNLQEHVKEFSSIYPDHVFDEKIILEIFFEYHPRYRKFKKRILTNYSGIKIEQNNIRMIVAILMLNDGIGSSTIVPKIKSSFFTKTYKFCKTVNISKLKDSRPKCKSSV